MLKFCSLYSGSSGNCLFVGSNNTKILVDSGLSGIKISRALEQIGERAEDIDAILVTHEHSDHISGIGVLSRKYNLPIYAEETIWGELTCIGEVKKEAKKTYSIDSEFQIGDININSFNTPHDAMCPSGFCLSDGKSKIVIATDIGCITEKMWKAFENSDFVFLESNHDINMLEVGKYPWFLKKRVKGDKGHLSNDTAAETVLKLAMKGTSKFTLGHLSRENNFPELAYQTTLSVLQSEGIVPGEDILLDVALRDRPSKVINL